MNSTLIRINTYELFDEISHKHELQNKYQLFYYFAFFEKSLEIILGEIKKAKFNKSLTKGTITIRNKIKFSWKNVKNGIFIYHEKYIFFFSTKRMEIKVQKLDEFKIVCYTIYKSNIQDRVAYRNKTNLI